MQWGGRLRPTPGAGGAQGRWETPLCALVWPQPRTRSHSAPTPLPKACAPLTDAQGWGDAQAQQVLVKQEERQEEAVVGPEMGDGPAAPAGEDGHQPAAVQDDHEVHALPNHIHGHQEADLGAAEGEGGNENGRWRELVEGTFLVLPAGSVRPRGLAPRATGSTGWWGRLGAEHTLPGGSRVLCTEWGPAAQAHGSSYRPPGGMERLDMSPPCRGEIEARGALGPTGDSDPVSSLSPGPLPSFYRPTLPGRTQHAW